MKIKNLLAVLFICAPACSGVGSGNYRVSIDENFSPEEIAVVKLALAEWESATDGAVTFRISNQIGNEDSISFAPASVATMTAASGEAETLGFTVRNGSVAHVQLDSADSTELFGQVVRHEIGHAVGLHHVEGRELMCAHRGCAALHVTCGDLVQFCEVWGCDSGELKLCGSD